MPDNQTPALSVCVGTTAGRDPQDISWPLGALPETFPRGRKIAGRPATSDGLWTRQKRRPRRLGDDGAAQ